MSPKKSRIPYLFIGFILAVVIIDSIYIYIASTTYSGVYTENHYQKGIDYMKVYKSGLDQNNQDIINVKIEDNIILLTAQHPVNSVQAKLISPVSKNDDSILHPKKIEGNNFTLSFNDFHDGQWELRLKINVSKEIYYQKFRFLKLNGKLKLIDQ